MKISLVDTAVLSRGSVAIGCKCRDLFFDIVRPISPECGELPYRGADSRFHDVDEIEQVLIAGGLFKYPVNAKLSGTSKYVQ